MKVVDQFASICFAFSVIISLVCVALIQDNMNQHERCERLQKFAFENSKKAEWASENGYPRY